MAKRTLEKDFLSKLGRRIRDHGLFFYKIPDAIKTGATRFIPPKPFDAIVTIESLSIGLEAKWLDTLSPFYESEIRQSQRDGLDDLGSKGKGLAIVVLGLKIKRGEKRLLFWEWGELKKDFELNGGKIPKEDLLNLPFWGIEDPTGIIQRAKEVVHFNNLVA